MVDAGEIFHPLRWTPRDAVVFLRDVPALEQSGIVVRVPANWKAGRPPRPTVQATVGTKPPAGLGLDALLDFQMDVALDGEALTPDEIRALLDGVDGLALLRGRWVEVDRDRLRGLIDEFRSVERTAAKNGLTFAEAMRLVSGASARNGATAADEEREWSGTVAGPWLAGVLQALRGLESLAHVDPGDALRGTLRPYQQVGVRWLHFLSSLGLGACLADDMGLGKTIQVPALLTVVDRERTTRARGERRPSLVVAPASLLANWAAEAARFAPGLSVLVAHPSAMAAGKILDGDELADVFGVEFAPTATPASTPEATVQPRVIPAAGPRKPKAKPPIVEAPPQPARASAGRKKAKAARAGKAKPTRGTKAAEKPKQPAAQGPGRPASASARSSSGRSPRRPAHWRR